MSGDLSELTRSSELLHVLVRLQRSGFTGVVYAEHEAESLVVSVRNGHPVFVEELGETVSIPDMLLEQGFVTKEQYADIATRVIESLSENEDIAFCEQAIAMGAVTAAQVEATLDKRIRGRLIQAVSWEECRIDIDGDPDSLSGIMELPQDLGSIIYVGVRTFFDDDRVRAALGGDEPHFVRLLRPSAEIETFFELESDDSALLAQLQPDRNVAAAIEQCAADSLEAYQLICMLRLADMAEVANAPFPPANERSGVRSTQAQPAAAAPAATPAPQREPQRPRSIAQMPAIREGSLRAPSQARMPIPREDPPRPSSQNRMPIPREEGGRRVPGVREERVIMPGSRQRMPAVDGPAPPQRPASPSATNTAAPVRPAEPAARAASPAARPVSPQPEARPSAPEWSNAAGQPARRQQSGAIAPPAPRPEPQPAAVASDPLTERKRPRRKLSQALQRLDRELKQMRPQTGPDEAPEEVAAPSHGRAHLEHLMRMRQANAGQRPQPGKEAPAAAPADGPFQKAQEALRDQQFGRAYELMRKACEAQPDNEDYAMFQLWAALRSNNLKEDGVTKLRTLLRARVSDDDHKKFAYYALGHLSLFEKKDEAAEKFFRKAIELDKNNKDAERHLRIIELRRKTATEQKNNKIFGIEIGNKKS